MNQVTVTIRKAAGPVDARAGQAFTQVLTGATDRELVNAPDEVLGARLITRREATLLERFRQLSPERQEAFVRYAAYAADVPRGGELLAFEEWAEQNPRLQ